MPHSRPTPVSSCSPAARSTSSFRFAVASAKVPVLDLASRYTELGEALLPLINPAVTSKYGLEIPSFFMRA